MVQIFLDNLKKTLRDLDITHAKEQELEESVTKMHDL
jgi:hypothetical protein